METKLTEVTADLRERVKVATKLEEVREEIRLLLEAYDRAVRDIYRAEHEEFSRWAQERQSWVNDSRTIFAEIPNLLAGMRAVMDSLDATETRFTQAPAEIQERLRNRKEGLSIICRMVERLPARKEGLEKCITEEFEAPEPLALDPQHYLSRFEKVEKLEDLPAQLEELLKEIGNAEETVRNQNYQRTRRLRLQTEGLKQAVLGFLRDHLLPAIDGLERGIWNEEELRRPLEGYGTDHELIDQWFGAYHDCDRLMEEFLPKVCLYRVQLTRGDVFDAQSHLALGHESCKELSDGQVLTILRSGWIFKDTLLRPAEVLVVRNDEEERDGKGTV